MTEIDYSKYTIEELRSVLTGIDKSKYPERVEAVEKHLDRLLDDPDAVLQSNSESDFFKSHVPSEIVTSIWLRIFGWSLVIALVVGLPVSIFFAFFFRLLGIDLEANLIVVQVFYWLMTLGFSWFFLRRILGTPAGNYEIVFHRKES